MKNKFKDGTKVIIDGPGENDDKSYNNVPARIIQCDPYYRDYLVMFEDGTEDWVLCKYIRERSKSK